MTDASDAQARNDRASLDAVHEADKSWSAEQLLADMRSALEARLDLRAMEPDEPDALTDEPIGFALAPEHEPIPYEVVAPVLSYADARRLVELGWSGVYALEGGGMPFWNDRGVLVRAADAIDANRLAQ